MFKKGDAVLLSLVLIVAIVAVIIMFAKVGPGIQTGMTGNIVKADNVGTTANVVATPDIKIPGCVDSDNGINPNVKGKVTYSDADYASAFIDFCRSYDSPVLKEYYCNNGHADYQDITCPNGCSNGVCNP